MSRRFLVVLVSFALGTVVVTASPVQGATSECEGSTSMYCEEWVFHLDGWNRSSSPVIADIDADGLNEIVFGHQDGKLRAYEADGTLKWESLAVPGVAPGCTSQTSASAIDSSPAVADLDKDGIPEVVVGVGSTWVSNQNGSVIAFNGKTGAMIWNFDRGRDEGNTWANTGTPDGYCGHVFATPAIGDIDGDGKLDVVFASWDFQIWAVDRFGEPLSGFPVNNDDSVWSSPALFDLDSDGDMEIFIGGDSTLGGYFDHQGGVFRALDWENGTVTELWHRTANEVFHASPAIGDINGDGRPEAIVSTGANWLSETGNASDHNKVFAFHLDDGSTVPGWPQSAGGTVKVSPVLGDLDGDGRPEVIAGSWDRKVYAWHGDGSLYWSVAPEFVHGENIFTARITSSPIIADLDGDGDQDVAAGTDFGLAMMSGQNGSPLEAGVFWPNKVSHAWSHEAAPAIGILGGERRIVVTGFDTPNHRTRVASFSLPSTSATDAWPMARWSPTRTGSLHKSMCELSGASGTFCDVSDSAYYAAGVHWMVENEITTGISSTLYGPNLVLTRAQMVTFLWRQEGSPLGYSAHGFGDVSAGSYYNGAVAWAKAEGITTGTGEFTFAPNASVTRAQLVTLLWRRSGGDLYQPPHGFIDVPNDRYYSVAVAWAKAEGVTTGTGEFTFSPSDNVTRAQAAAMLYREAVS
ncbi:MAG: FG-GAP-like repeat-containing protein [Acidimicrobiales bacterium]|nr:FG-GAP-like repeat-containing protein [Acidimicrobiales bacterium]